MRRGPIVSNKAHCVSGAESDRSNPNLQVAWRRLQPPLPPLITTGNQLACLDTRSARHETSLGSSGDTVLLGKQPRGFSERPGRPRFSFSIPPPPHLLREGGRVTDLHPQQMMIFRFSFGCVSVYLIPGWWCTALCDDSVITSNAPLQMETATFCPSHRQTWTKNLHSIHKSLRSQSTRPESMKYSPYQTLLALLSCLQPDLRQVELFGQDSISKH